MNIYTEQLVIIIILICSMIAGIAGADFTRLGGHLWEFFLSVGCFYLALFLLWIMHYLELEKDKETEDEEIC